MAYDTVTFQKREAEFKSLNRLTKEMDGHAAAITNDLTNFKSPLVALFDATKRLRIGFSLEGMLSEDDVKRLVGLEVGRVLGADFALFSFSDFTISALTAPEKIPTLYQNTARTTALLGKNMSAAHDAADKAADHAAVMAYVEEVKARLKNKEEGTVP
jgi:hypothetical protein